MMYFGPPSFSYLECLLMGLSCFQQQLCTMTHPAVRRMNDNTTVILSTFIAHLPFKSVVNNELALMLPLGDR